MDTLGFSRVSNTFNPLTKEKEALNVRTGYSREDVGRLQIVVGRRKR